MRLLGVASGLLQRTALAQQVPALVELDLHALQALVLGVREPSLLEQAMLLGYEVLDAAEYGTVGGLIHENGLRRRRLNGRAPPAMLGRRIVRGRRQTPR